MVAAERRAVSKAASANRMLLLHSSLLGIGLFMGLAGFQVVQRRVTRPISAITRTMRRLAMGEVAVEIPGTARKDEIGEMAEAVKVFKENALERQRVAKEHRETTERAADKRRIEMRQLADHFEAAIGNIVETVSSSATELEATAGTLTSTQRRPDSCRPGRRVLAANLLFRALGLLGHGGDELFRQGNRPPGRGVRARLRIKRSRRQKRPMQASASFRAQLSELAMS